MQRWERALELCVRSDLQTDDKGMLRALLLPLSPFAILGYSNFDLPLQVVASLYDVCGSVLLLLFFLLPESL